MYTYRLIELTNGWGYEILLDGVVIARQEFMPGAEGFTPMTMEQAEAEAIAALGALERPAPVPDADKEAKLRAISQTCEQIIFGGVDVEIGGERLHFSLTTEDQINLSTAMQTIEAGAPAFPYHSDKGLCRLYGADEIRDIYSAAEKHKLYHTTYCNHLNFWTHRVEGLDEFDGIYYGAELPEDLAANMSAVLEAASP